jgi:spermidine synthase
VPWLNDAQLNRDRDLRLQYLAGIAFNVYASGQIYSQLAPYRHYPTDLFVGTNAWTGSLRLALEPRGSEK